ncbi:hypothetical protein [Glycomyces sp. YM15]|uniref:hypothetical protein n=1 Tax=Glycomyces sp. YM15 TaxID=2800446 RepID=UPI00196591F3|nr:hypothetical protein [Glycomyces sp. YM15]
MSEDIYVFEAIDVDPPVSEAEVKAQIAVGKYQKVTWEDDGRIGDGYFVKVGESGEIGLAMTPKLGEDGVLRHRGICVQGNPLDEAKRDSTIEAELREILADFGTAPDGTPRSFGSAIYIQKDDVEYKVSVEEGRVVRVRVEPPEARTEQEQPLNLSVTEYEADLLRQMVALDINDWKSGDMPTDPMDPDFARRRAEASEALLAKLNEILG